MDENPYNSMDESENPYKLFVYFSKLVAIAVAVFLVIVAIVSRSFGL